ncbi:MULTISPECIES: hypothetical protein [Leptolyngbya]|jgi:hypothetical protein|uniref:SPOR domain-containing protein n=1 Tax=Leptolyngbya boryana NIES-2135 TaxID=1973484 RepID=A0A1Z4JCP1_LEPBY|nr:MULTISPECIES: hypothetical protein [Leptolyngbya]BAY54501.1 hypothetical protein NIES2135_13180 [Leptolyngbya boryana NIES-2135]MBD1859926.1 hypothetical protein [Leptolyngbya sp. FACHB-1624]MBD2365496.1 hypothetical protein [Leptolyngbya sp. FACHB-161]MBD2371676.1 hypothetical protein [Leptolyngbya sp. FACHB-238]MBD2396101.1 hypothetical protein [Leptolyngbya sp. FACHB-239]
MPQMPFQTVFKAIAGMTLVLNVIPPASAQLANCQAPRSNEPLLLVVTRTPEAQARLRSVISRDAEVSVCNYFGETVTRIGGYRDTDTANSWAGYLNETVKLRTFVALPAGGQVASQPEVPVQAIDLSREPVRTATLSPEPINPNPSGYNPRALEDGFAVIVNHYNRPEVAAQMQQVLNRNIGLVSFEQRPFLLAVHTRDRGSADRIMQILNDRGFAAMLVSGRRLTLLTPVVQTDSAIGGR